MLTRHLPAVGLGTDVWRTPLIDGYPLQKLMGLLDPPTYAHFKGLHGLRLLWCAGRNPARADRSQVVEGLFQRQLG
jgi:hypothetical protein